jgi:hypothetical protein
MYSDNPTLIPVEQIVPSLFIARGQLVLLDCDVQVVRAFMRMRDEVRNWLASNAELAVQIAHLKRRVEGHDVVVDILQTLCELLKAPEALPLTDAQRAEFSRLLEEYVIRIVAVAHRRRRARYWSFRVQDQPAHGYSAPSAFTSATSNWASTW